MIHCHSVYNPHIKIGNDIEAWQGTTILSRVYYMASPLSSGHKSAGAECGASAQNQATTHRQNCHNIAMFIFDKWKSEIKQNGYYSSFHFFY